MINLHFQDISRKIKNKPAALPLVFTSFMLLVGNYGCVKQAQVETQLEIKNVQILSSNSLYRVNGSTNLPESSRVTVTAVRYLRPTAEQPGALLNSDANTKRSILARQIVQVKQGKWQADLNLWQVAPNGSFEEEWQANQIQMKLTPESDVTFIATFDPVGQWEKSDNHKSQEKLKLENYRLEGKLVRFTNEGEKYAQVSQTLSIPLPTGKTTPSLPQPEDLNGGWGNRYQILPEPKVTRSTLIAPAKSRQTNASLLSSEFLR
ncbi:hypothetical protein [Nostoc sp. 106C]|uniref:hypothetical protein n=1 Tax=Nostoc sp. 106C TaxID=1932667 RepID=UPI000A3AB99A|nr:hypothetical protein [Nostoc sp. 106C]OUL22012.1 hypothetical protein BV375_27890 [Nostoc sp. 106C]